MPQRAWRLLNPIVSFFSHDGCTLIGCYISAAKRLTVVEASDSTGIGQDRPE